MVGRAAVGVVLSSRAAHPLLIGGAAALVTGGLVVLVRHWGRQRVRRSVALAEERERAVLDVLASADPAALVVFTLRRARGYAHQARRAAERGTSDRRRAGRLAQLERDLSHFRVSGAPVDDLVNARRLEASARGLVGVPVDAPARGVVRHRHSPPGPWRPRHG